MPICKMVSFEAYHSYVGLDLTDSVPQRYGYSFSQFKEKAFQAASLKRLHISARTERCFYRCKDEHAH